MSKIEHYTRIAIVLHWLIALGVIWQIAIGWSMIEIPKNPPGARVYWFNFHKSIGLTLGMLILLRVVWRFTHGAPPLPASIPEWQRLAAKASHFGLYACMIIMPVSGYLGSSFTKYPIKYFGYTLPHWGWDAPAYKEICSQVHYVTVIVFIALIVIHFAAAVKHMIARDGVIRRMWR
ncbi:MAG TPA: cytochrome b [Burkholderiales bacterium]|nr:cytochrome b [Burkholderiales bacterium]